MNRQNRISRSEFLSLSACATLGVAIGTASMPVRAQDAAAPRFEVSLHPFSLKKLFDEGQLDLKGYPKFAKETLGIANIEHAVEFCGDLYDAPEKGGAIRQAALNAGVKTRVFLCGAEPALDAVEPVQREAAVAAHLKWVKVAEHLGCEYIRVRASTPGDAEAQLDRAAESIGTLCDQLEDSPLSVLIENIVEHSRNPAWLAQLVERVGKERLGLIADFGNFDGDVYEGMRQLMPYTKSVCAKSWDFDADGNETQVDYQRMIDIIKDSEYRGCIAIEYLGDDPVGGVKKTAALIRKYAG